ncbi:hypothetical protein [Flammeovirga kamogawensis]|uniref:Uncharacterized protein n=1 Tax=Flammeovirga kamogawensis TaxID=373891 RepID=A0ABX8GTB5_9BACT|nr:hypothetical protein [Flammeovirga kamogawensis]MBB6463364.1 hypothetical protein [Flammeovirga kamogawensis]QWG06664.1 hypothetical protein KM029_15310 [Flammeovirga kamogawensis]TRX68486.1 hypothetical protein EO216_10305 [Flammeovirga kamogawensis]
MFTDLHNPDLIERYEVLNNYKKNSSQSKCSTYNTNKGFALFIDEDHINKAFPILQELKNKRFKNPVYLFYLKSKNSLPTFQETLLRTHFNTINVILCDGLNSLTPLSIQTELFQLTDFQYCVIGQSFFVDKITNLFEGNHFIQSKDIHKDTY